MSNLNERVNDVMDILEDHISNNNMGAVKQRIRKALQEQDKVTREACSSDINKMNKPYAVGECFSKYEMTEVIMNCQGGFK